MVAKREKEARSGKGVKPAATSSTKRVTCMPEPRTKRCATGDAVPDFDPATPGFKFDPRKPVKIGRGNCPPWADPPPLPATLEPGAALGVEPQGVLGPVVAAALGFRHKDTEAALRALGVPYFLWLARSFREDFEARDVPSAVRKLSWAPRGRGMVWESLYGLLALVLPGPANPSSPCEPCAPALPALCHPSRRFMEWDIDEGGMTPLRYLTDRLGVRHSTLPAYVYKSLRAWVWCMVGKGLPITLGWEQSRAFIPGELPITSSSPAGTGAGAAGIGAGGRPSGPKGGTCSHSNRPATQGSVGLLRPAVSPEAPRPLAVVLQAPRAVPLLGRAARCGTYPNGGNTCYFAAVLQALQHLPQFMQLVQAAAAADPGSVCSSLLDLMTKCTSGDRVHLGTHHWLAGLSPAFVWKTQGVACEFYISVADKCKDACPQHRTVVHFDVRSSVTCLSCGVRAVRSEAGCVLTLALPERPSRAPVALTSLLGRYFHTEHLRGVDQFECSVCACKVSVQHLRHPSNMLCCWDVGAKCSKPPPPPSRPLAPLPPIWCRETPPRCCPWSPFLQCWCCP